MFTKKTSSIFLILFGYQGFLSALGESTAGYIDSNANVDVIGETYNCSRYEPFNGDVDYGVVFDQSRK